MRNVLKNKYIVGLTVVLLILVVSYRYSSKRIELFGHYDKVWAHRVNDLKKLKSAEGRFSGMELDLVFVSHKNDFDIYHPPKPSKGFYFSKFLAELQNERTPLWLDMKNLSKENASAVLKTLEHLLKKYAMLKHRSQIIVESTDAFSLPLFQKAGFRTSFYIVERINETNKTKAIRNIDDTLKQLSTKTEISSNYHNYSFLKTAFPDRKKNFWILTSTYDWETIERFSEIRGMLNDTSVQTVLIPYINFNRHF